MKQRLLGAAVLIALAVIFVPMLFSGSGPKQESETVNLEIPPGPSREFETRVLSVDAASRDRVPVPAPSSERVVTVDTEVPERVEDPPAPALPSVTTATPDPPLATVKPAIPAQVVAGEAAISRFLVHLGIYTSSKNAEDLVAVLNRGGFPAFAEATEVQGKTAQRVRVGPYADRAEAEAARIRIKQIKSDVPGSVVSLAGNATADAPASAMSATRAGGWAVQLGAFKTAEDANKLRGRMQGGGFVAYVDKLATEGQTLWRVRAGPETDRANAEKLRERIREKLKLDGLVVTQP